jgi:hypothetical protein
MAKQDVLNAINSTIATNNTKGITAESLNSVLTMMVENAGEGGGGSGSGEGMLRLIVPDYIEIGYVFVEEFGEFSPSVLSEMRSEIESEDPEYAQLYEPLFTACEDAFTHNAEVYRIIKEKANNDESCSVLLDMTPIIKAYYDVIMIIEDEGGEYIDEYLMSFSQIATVAYISVKYKPEFGDFSYENLAVMPFLVPMSESDSAFYPSNILLIINPDGSMIFEKLEPSSDYTLYIAASGNTLESYYRENYNLKIRNSGYDALGKTVEIREISSGSSLIGRFMIHEVIEDEGFLFFNGCDLKKCTIDSEGNASIVTIGSIAIQQNS